MLLISKCLLEVILSVMLVLPMKLGLNVYVVPSCSHDQLEDGKVAGKYFFI